MLVLKYLETNFDKQTLKVKLELILFPFIIVVVLVLVINYTNKVHPLDEKIDTVINFEEITMKKRILPILNDLEIFIKKNNIQLKKISNTKKSINIEMKSNLINQIKFIKFVEDYNSFSKVKFLKKEGEILILEIIFDKFYIKNSFDLESKLPNLHNPKIKNNSFKLFAIVDNKALINDKWQKIGDFIYSYKIMNIKINSLILNNGLDTIELMINKNENN